jgi:hypothetical protein
MLYASLLAITWGEISVGRGGFWIVGNISGHLKPRFRIQYMIQNKNQVTWTPWYHEILALTFAWLEGVALECIFRQ